MKHSGLPGEVDSSVGQSSPELSGAVRGGKGAGDIIVTAEIADIVVRCLSRGMPVMASTTQAQYTTLEEWTDFLSRAVDARHEPLKRRKHRRYPFDGYVTIRGEYDGVSFKQIWTLRQVSLEGLMVLARHEMPLWIAVTIVLKWNNREYLLRGATCHCTQTVGGYKVGIQLQFSSSPADDEAKRRAPTDDMPRE